MWNLFIDYFWPLLVATVDISLAVFMTLHAVLQKRESRTILGWLGLIWLVPILGSFMYYCFRINRIARKAVIAQERIEKKRQSLLPEADSELELFHREPFSAYKQLGLAIGKISRRPLLHGNFITPFINGDEAYPAMLDAIGRSKETIGLSTYIFDLDRAGLDFVDALAAAQQRGVEVRVLIDAVGARYSMPTSLSALRMRDINTRLFLPTLVPRLPNYANLRNHRKILTIDGTTGFTGGMNIREGNCLKRQPKHPIQDVHFQITGPVFRHLQETFIADWWFAANEALDPGIWFHKPPRAGGCLGSGNL